MTDYTFHTVRDGTLTESPIEVFSYPMGDVTVRPIGGTREFSPQGTEVMWVRGSSVDWSLVYAWSDLARRSQNRVLVLPYLPSARGDKDTPSPASINAKLAAGSGITSLITLDPHSDVWLDNLDVSSRRPTMDPRHPAWGGETESTVEQFVLPLSRIVQQATAGVKYTAVIAPDAGAVARAGQVATALRLPLLHATKHRDPETGRLSSYKAPVIPEGCERVLVVDDICDGGGTFKLLADAFHYDVILDLWVSHGGFTKGIETILEDYDRVYTTDSLPSASAAVGSSNSFRVHVTELTPYVSEVLEVIEKGGGAHNVR